MSSNLPSFLLLSLHVQVLRNLKVDIAKLSVSVLVTSLKLYLVSNRERTTVDDDRYHITNSAA